jgi:hypothetical protein
MSLQSITLDTGATLTGRALARNGGVTLDSHHYGPVTPSTKIGRASGGTVLSLSQTNCSGFTKRESFSRSRGHLIPP